ncbi:MAG: hypothetical protein ACI3ZP_02805 [Candidatus Cryptobacteroides sp.]
MKRTIVRFLAMFWTAVSALAIAGCNEEVRNPESPEFSGLQFSVVSEPETSEGVRIIITHDGNDRCTYYGFATKDVSADVNALVNREARRLSESGTDWKSQLKQGAKRVLTLTGLSSGTDYRYIVFGLNEDGTVYGVPGSCRFTTVKGVPKLSLSLVTEPTDRSALVKVTTTGDNSDKWYIFLTKDLDTPASTLCQSVVSSVVDIESKLQGGNLTKEFSGLTHYTKYRAVVMNVRNGAVYGDPAEIVFKTTMRPIDPMLNPDWNIVCEGEGEITTGDATNRYRQVISCTTATSEMYFIMVMSKESMKYYDGQFDQFLIDAAAYMTAYIEQYNEVYGTGYTWADIAYRTSVREGYNLRTTGLYNAYAIGVEVSGAPTGKYAVSPDFEVTLPEMTEEYKAWLGDWTIGDSKVKYNIAIEDDREEDDNLYKVYGWESISDFDKFPAYAELDRETGNLRFLACELGEVNVRNDQNISVACMLGFYGASGMDVLMSGPDNSYGIAIAEMSGAGSATVTGITLEIQGQSISITSMGYFAQALDKSQLFSFSSTYPAFPCTMVKKTETSAASPRMFIMPATPGNFGNNNR